LAIIRTTVTQRQAQVIGEQKVRLLQTLASAWKMEQHAKRSRDKSPHISRDKGKSPGLSKSHEVLPCFLHLHSKRLPGILTDSLYLNLFEKIFILNNQINLMYTKLHKGKKALNKNVKY
jgi:hypothetical protein